ncbi:hypothetical protein D8666_19820 [Ochrobactrum soli]|uniref:hypothetical protein n=1 Tax=Ochrobactrum soli TaxID=2448455 RepID=UPI000EF22F1A|nr:hypothetical protein [[Ochrobactrum] soli]RLL71533.1 hypothetical protein D8666_19820 [[Ochrobactrum] soli]
MAIKAKTLSAAEIESDHRRFIQDTDEIKLHTETVTNYPALWERCPDDYGLTWSRLPFDPVSQDRVPKTQGLYAFVVQPTMRSLPPSAWLFYIGEVGATNSPNRTFWKRYSEYIEEYRTVTRPKLAVLFERYKGHIHFYFSEIDPTVHDIKKIESELITAAWPVANIKDFNVRMRKARRAFA